MSDITDEWLTPEGMAKARSCLTSHYDWFIHWARAKHFPEIVGEGLVPMNPNRVRMPVVEKALGLDPAPGIICFRPEGSGDVMDSTPTYDELLFKVAIPKSALPATITVDWTFSSAWELGPIIKRSSPEIPTEHVFCEVARRRGSFAIYQAIRPALLHAFTKGSPEADPSTWPHLPSTNFQELVLRRGG